MAAVKRKAQMQEERRHFDEALPKVIEQIIGTRLDETSDAVEHLKRVNISNLFCFCLKIESQNKKVQQKRNCSRFPKGPHRPDAIRQRDANFQFSKTNKTVNG